MKFDGFLIMKKENNSGRGASLMAPGFDRLVSKREAAGLFGVSVRTLERMISAGQLSILKVRGCVRLRLSQVLRLAGIENPLTSSQS